MLRDDIIEQAVADWASLIVFAQKKDRSLRFFVDYRQLHTVNVRDLYLLPMMDECIDALGEEIIVMTLDANSVSRQAEIDKEDREKTAFTG